METLCGCPHASSLLRFCWRVDHGVLGLKRSLTVVAVVQIIKWLTERIQTKSLHYPKPWVSYLPLEVVRDYLHGRLFVLSLFVISRERKRGVI